MDLPTDVPRITVQEPSRLLRLDIRNPFYEQPESNGAFPKFKVTLNLLTQSHAPKLYAVLTN